MKKKRIIENWNLYVITDEQLGRGRTHLELAREAIAGGAEVIQLRDKAASGKKLYDVGLELRRLTQEKKVTFIINDRVDLAMLVEADGVHIGQTDFPARAVRRLIGPSKILGVSVASLSEAIQAEADGADYLGVGPVFEARKTKSDAGNPLGLEILQQIRNNCCIPIVAIGGINSEKVAGVIQAGADAVAIISAIISAENVSESARQIKSIILKEKNIK